MRKYTKSLKLNIEVLEIKLLFSFLFLGFLTIICICIMQYVYMDHLRMKEYLIFGFLPQTFAEV